MNFKKCSTALFIIPPPTFPYMYLLHFTRNHQPERERERERATATFAAISSRTRAIHIACISRQVSVRRSLISPVSLIVGARAPFPKINLGRSRGPPGIHQTFKSHNSRAALAFRALSRFIDRAPSRVDLYARELLYQTCGVAGSCWHFQFRSEVIYWKREWDFQFL